MRCWRQLLLAIFVGTVLAACQPARQPFNATDLTGSTLGGNLALTDHHGQPRQLSDFVGKAVIVFFGYTQCPDVCPTNMTAMRQVVDLLAVDSKRVQVVFVTLDPERDSRELLAQYVPAFHPDFLGLFGTVEQTAQVAKDFHIFYQKQPSGSSGSYSLDHSTGSYIFDPKGKLRLYFRHGEAPEKVASDVARLLAGE